MLAEPPPLPPPDRSGYAPVDGVRLYYQIFNARAGKPVILLHGGLGSMRDWAFQVPALAAAHEVIAVDSRGQGRSTRTSEPFQYETMAGDVVGLMDHLGIERASIVGWSDGGIIGLLLAIDHRERVDKLLAFGANYHTGGLKPGIADDPTLAAAAAIQRRLYEAVSPTPEGFDALAASTHAMWGAEPDIAPAALATITTPTVIADGANNEAVKPEHTRELARLIPGARLEILPAYGDFLPWQDPAAFNRAVLDFLDGS